MNLPSALIKKVLEEEDFDTWCNIRKHYLPSEYHKIYSIVEKHVDKYGKLPSIEELKFEIRDEATLEKIVAIDSIEVDAEPFLLLDYVKNEFTQRETLIQLEKYVKDSISFENAKETIDSLYNIIADIESKVELEDETTAFHNVDLFEPDEVLDAYIKLGLNSEYDELCRFRVDDYIMIGGRRGAGKSIVCANVAHNVNVTTNRPVVYFTIEMRSQEILQRLCSIATQIPLSKIKYKKLDNSEWLKIANWWASRYVGAEKALEEYKLERSFSEFQKKLSRLELAPNQVHVIYDPELTLPKLKAEVSKLMKKFGDLAIVVVDYLQQIKLTANAPDIYDWKDQIKVSKGLKLLAQTLKVPFLSPFQIDEEGKARLSRGILDSPDAAFNLKANKNMIQFECVKMRSGEEKSFASVVNWSCVTIGPETAEPIEPDNSKTHNKTFSKRKQEEVYDD